MVTDILPTPMLVDAALGANMALEAINSDVSILGGNLVTPLSSVATTDVTGLREGAVVTIPVDVASSAWTATDEATPAPSDTDRTLGSVTFSMAGFTQKMSATDALRYRDPTGAYQVPALVAWMLIGAFLTAATQLAALADSLTEEVGATNAALTWDVILEARDEIIARGKNQAGGPYLLIVHPRAWAQVSADLATADGARAQRRLFDETQTILPQGFQGQWDDIIVYTSDLVADDGTGYSSMLFSRRAIAHHFGASRPQTASEFRLVDVMGITVEEVRDANTRSIELHGYMEYGCCILRDQLGCRILSEIP